MINIEPSLQQTIQQAFKELFNAEIPLSDISLQATRKDFEGSHTFVTFPFGKLTKKNPAETARLIGEYLQNNTRLVSNFNVVQGFLNLSIADEAWLEIFKTIVQQADFGFFPANGRPVMVEYSSPNTNKPLHLGHLRNIFLGYSLAQILQANGYTVIKSNVVNDRGIHICKSMLAYQKFGNGETPQSSGMKGDHLIGKYYVLFDKAYRQEIDVLKTKGMDDDEAKKQASLIQEAQQMLVQWEEGNPEVVGLWKKMNGWVYEGFDQTYKRLGVDFDKIYYESDTYLLGKDIVEEGLAKGIFFKKENGSVWIDLTAEGLDEKLVLRADGTSVYVTQDLGTADLKYNDFGIEKSIYVVGNEQDWHFNVLFAILKKLGKPYVAGLYHLSYGMVDLPSGRMKSREGTVVDADDLMEEMVQTATARTQELGKIEEFTEEGAKALYEMLGIGALKYFLLKVDPKKRMLFNPDEAIEFQGHTATFIQFSYARISSIVRKAEQLQMSLEWSGFKPLYQEEKDLIGLLSLFPDKVKEAGEQYAPSIIAQYAYDLSKEYSRFYTVHSIFNADTEDEKRFRVSLSAQVGKTIRIAMGLLGIQVPERM